MLMAVKKTKKSYIIKKINSETIDLRAKKLIQRLDECLHIHSDIIMASESASTLRAPS